MKSARPFVALALAAGLLGHGAFAADAPRPALPAAKATQFRLLGVAVADARLTAVGQQGVILQSSDGKTWQQVASPVSSMLNRVRYLDGKRGWIVGYDASVLSTSDGGASWTLQHFDPEGRALHDVLFLDDRQGLAIGAYGTVLLTADGGASWTPQASVLADLSLHLNAIVKLGDGSLLVAGESGLLARSTDRGGSWQLLKSPYVGSWFGALPHGDKGALLFGMRGKIFSAEDVSSLATEDSTVFGSLERQSAAGVQQTGGVGWRALDNPVRESLFGGSLLAPDRAVLVGVNGAITRADLASGAMQPMEKLKDEPLSDAVVFNGQLIVVGRRGVQNLGVLP